jgi:hypothetical protein
MRRTQGYRLRADVSRPPQDERRDLIARRFSERQSPGYNRVLLEHIEFLRRFYLDETLLNAVCDPSLRRWLARGFSGAMRP